MNPIDSTHFIDRHRSSGTQTSAFRTQNRVHHEPDTSRPINTSSTPAASPLHAGLRVPYATDEVGLDATLVRQVAHSPGRDKAITNLLYVAEDESALAVSNIAEVQGRYYFMQPDDDIASGSVGFNTLQRSNLRFAIPGTLELRPVKAALPVIDTAVLRISRVTKTRDVVTVDHQALLKHLAQAWYGLPLGADQDMLVDFDGMKLKASCIRMTSNAPPAADVQNVGTLDAASALTLEALEGSGLAWTGRPSAPRQLFRDQNFDFLSLGIGGLSAQFEQIFRRAFQSRTLAPELVQQLGLKHTKGVLLYGPPGTGKTLIARKIAHILNTPEPKIVNGPELLSKFVGESEQNVRNLFMEARTDEQRHGGESPMHVIIFDEIDALCRARGTRSNDTGVGDSVVNQLLTQIDGVEALNNVLLIGMTNRKDMLDEALLRPGRMDVHVEIGLPDRAGRSEILTVHTQKIRDNRFTDDLDIAWLAENTQNYSGAELECLVSTAISFAVNRQVDVKNLARGVDASTVRVSANDFEQALAEVKPALGVNTEPLQALQAGGTVDYGPRFLYLKTSLQNLVEQVRVSDDTPLMSVLLQGPAGSGKTALAAKLALESGFPFVRLLSQEMFETAHEMDKCARIAKIFEDAYKSPMSFLMIDDIERLFDYVPVGPRFSVSVLQLLLGRLKRRPPSGHRMFVLATSGASHVLQSLQLAAAFSIKKETLELSQEEMQTLLLQHDDVVSASVPQMVREMLQAGGRKSTPVKQLLGVLKNARFRAMGAPIEASTWREAIGDLVTPSGGCLDV